ncbi:MAG TPA: hypothetical protein VLL25_18590, partial [Acidimicrobiales bacterium]|nr:hypothetical protein [Acidimicrobiales bacterium]
PFPNTQKAYAELFDGLPDRVVDKVSHLNAERLFDWKMADASLATPDAQWSPPPDYRPRFAIEHVETSAAAKDPHICHVLVTKGNLSVECGATVGADGRCQAGH